MRNAPEEKKRRLYQTSLLLVVEVDDHFRRNLVERLRLEGYQVLEADEAASATRIMHTRQIAVVLIGLGGLKQQGLALLKSIKAMRPFVEVILLTPAEDHSLSLSMEGMRLGAFDDILIPFDMETLIGRIREAHEHRRRSLGAKRQVSLKPSESEKELSR